MRSPLRSAEGPVAIVAGREDSGLTNDELDACHALVTISTDPGHPSLNLAQAVGIMAYESWLARGGDDVPLKPPRRRPGPPPRNSSSSSSATGIGLSPPSTSSRPASRST